MRNERFWSVAVALVVSVLMVGRMAWAEEEEKDEHVIKGSITVSKDAKPAQLAKMAKLTFAQALKTALKKVPGSAVKGELESEDGYLVYSFEIVETGGNVTEVEVDSGKGTILDIDREEAKKGKDEDKDGEEK